MEIVSFQVKGEVFGYELLNFVEFEVVEIDLGERGNMVSGGVIKLVKLELGVIV